MTTTVKLPNLLEDRLRERMKSRRKKCRAPRFDAAMSLRSGTADGDHVAEQPMRWRSAPRIGAVLVDSGPLLALFNRSDSWHARIMMWLSLNPQAKLITTWPVMTQVCALLARRVHNEAALDFLRWAQRGGLACDAPVQASLATVLQISVRFASLPFDLVDASVAEASSRLNIQHILSVDSDFDVYRDPAGQALVNLLRA